MENKTYFLEKLLTLQSELYPGAMAIAGFEMKPGLFSKQTL